MIKGGGSGDDNTSVWLVVWGPNTIHGIYPKGSMPGSSTPTWESRPVRRRGWSVPGYRTHYKWDLA